MEEMITIPTPDEIPQTSLRALIPEEHTLHSSIEAALSQNEDLMARLKVTLRRLTNTENENLELKRNLQALTRRFNAAEDERSIWKERETTMVEQIKAFEIRVIAQKTMAKEISDLKEKLGRYKKYQEKIRTQVKPYVQNLKNYSDSLVREVQELHTELARRESEVSELEEKCLNFEREALELKETHAVQLHRMTEQAEKDREQLLTDLSAAKTDLKHLSDKAIRYDEMRLKEDELENTLISVRRERDLSIKELRSREQALLEELGLAKIKVVELQTTQESLQEKTEMQMSERSRLEAQITSLQEQMASLRFMWSSQTEEIEKLRASQSALEKLNSELSRQLNQLTK